MITAVLIRFLRLGLAVLLLLFVISMFWVRRPPAEDLHFGDANMLVTIKDFNDVAADLGCPMDVQDGDALGPAVRALHRCLSREIARQP